MAGTYTIGTKAGYDIINAMKPGESRTIETDGSVWTKNADGTISVMHNGVQKVGQITYQPTGSGAAAQTGYQSPYAEQLNAAIAQLGNSQWQGWNKDEDESYQAYRKAYLREADRTMQDTLGQYAQNTGGIAGSSAINAASQAADYYKSQLNDKVPELYDAAYNRHLNDLALQQQNINMLMNAESQNASLYYQQLNYAMQKWAQMGYADAEVAGILGVAEGTPTSDQAYTDWSKSFGGGSSGGGSGISGGNDAGTQFSYEQLYLDALASGNATNYLMSNYKKYGLSSTEGLVDGYDEWLENYENPSVSSANMIDGKPEDDFTMAVYQLIQDPTYVQKNQAFQWIDSQFWTSAQKAFAREVWMSLVGYSGG